MIAHPPAAEPVTAGDVSARVLELRADGLTIRQIAASVGVSYSAVRRHLLGKGPIGRVAPDSKPMTSVPNQPTAPSRRPLAAAFRGAVIELARAVERVERLTEDPRFPKTADEIARVCGGDLQRASQQLYDLTPRIPNGKETSR